jgi:hypothetical protein
MKQEQAMNHRKRGAKAIAIEGDVIKQSVNPLAGSNLAPMLVIGLLLTLAGMLAALALD